MTAVSPANVAEMHRFARLNGLRGFMALCELAGQGADWANARLADAWAKIAAATSGAEIAALMAATDCTEPAAADTIERLRGFAERHGEIAFAHLCTAAVAGEAWARERIVAALAAWQQRGNWDSHVLEAIRTTDTTRPDGAIARGTVTP